MALGEKRIRIDAMDQGFYGDSAEAAAYLDMEGVYQFLGTDMEMLREELRRSIPPMRVYEVKHIRDGYMVYYQQIAKDFIKAILEETDPGFLLAGINSEPQVTVLFGGYMDRADVILELKGGGR